MQTGTSVVLAVESITGTTDSELGISITVSEVPCSQSSFSGQSLVGITDAHSRVDVMVADVVDIAVTTSAVQSQPRRRRGFHRLLQLQRALA
jgi:hypothetical protein